ncbi:MAG: hypothetical protein KFB96_25885 [Thiocapsa sp.]|uniref:hypothetical protein n=1 Tax=Thiocapsa sp. TaxID=2024551 RepID=UPI001BCF3684|nr:hypothetical protein [Thiocapsa sp.]QVL48918.1 MAG: hypothetical protein KFB96_25885 [Thiocapsa sp.]
MRDYIEAAGIGEELADTDPLGLPRSLKNRGLSLVLPASNPRQWQETKIRQCGGLEDGFR